ncbi:AMP-dependent synthetase/ligase [Rhodococcus wratislaviensis]|uniref:AMP-dependent synthetase/ligase n=1 Tax=Rhodococcus wratislaviensis TaxID=44752 RepID=UPI00365C3D07
MTSNSTDTVLKPARERTVPAAFGRAVALWGDQVAFRSLGDAVSLTWYEAERRVRDFAAGLTARGLSSGDRIAMLLPNTIECHLLDHAATHLGAVPFAIFNSSSPEQIAYQVSTAKATVVVTDIAFRARVTEAIDLLGAPVELIVAGVDSADGLAQLERDGAKDIEFDLAVRRAEVGEEDLATLIYTSGTTGKPKAVEWTHRGVMSQLRALEEAVPLSRVGIVSFLPLAHAGGRTNALYGSLVHGATVTECPDISRLNDCVLDARPDTLFSTPRVFEKLRAAIETLVEAEPEPRRGTLRDVIDIGMRRGRRDDRASGPEVGELTPEQVSFHQASVAEFSPVLRNLGLDRLRSAFVGGAPSAPELVYFFRAIGVPLLEAYGSTETGQNIFNRVDDFKTGTAGRALPGVELKVAPDGELLARSSMNMRGYLDRPGDTAAALDGEGWVYTGDIVTMDDDGFVTIVDRKKELIINSSGKNMSPAFIESTVKAESSLIGQVVAIGDGRRYVTGLITLEPEALPRLVDRYGLQGTSLEDMAKHPRVLDEIGQAVDRANCRMNSNEQLKKFVIVPEVWSPDGDELTPTGKLKRRVVHDKYATQIESLYS